MSDTSQATTPQATRQNSDVQPAFNPAASLAGAAAFAGAESAEILNLLGDSADGGSCCGGGCCSTE